MVYEGSTLPSGDEIRNTGLAARGRTLLPARVLRYFRRPGLAVSDFPAPSIETRSTAALVDLNDEIATEFNLGPKAGELAEQVMRLIAEQPGGLAGFLEKLKECGCGAPALLGYAISPRTANSAAAGLVNVANTAAVTCPLVPGLGTCEITGDFAVAAGWTKNLTAEFDSYDSANPKLHFAGNTSTMKRAIQVAGYSTRKIDSPQSARFNETENQSKNRSLHIN